MAFVAALAEGALRAAGFAPQRFGRLSRVATSKGVIKPGATALDCYPSNPRGYFDVDLRDPATLARFQAMRMRNLDRVIHDAPYAVEFHYNQLCYRDREFGPRKAGVRRVAVLGDSFTEGQGAREADVYPRALERLLNEAEPGRWEVLNFGRRNADFPELHGRLVTVVLKFDPDVVVYGMVLNDPAQSEAYHAQRSWINNWILDHRRRAATAPTPPLGPFDLRLASLAREAVETYRVSAESRRWYHGLYGHPNRHGWTRTKEYLRDMDERTRRRGGRFLIAVWPLLVGLEGRYPFEDIHATVGAFARKSGIPFHDMLPALRGHRTSSLWIHPVDMHPNEIGHRLAAESLVEPVRRLAREVAPDAALRQVADGGGSGRPQASPSP
jgi:lysophospholipase L1-like esterase